MTFVFVLINKKYGVPLNNGEIFFGIIRLRWVLFVIFLLLLIFFFMYVILMILRFNCKKVSTNRKQVPEVIDNKYIVFSDQYRTNLIGRINSYGKKIIIGVYDIYGNLNNFNGFLLFKKFEDHISFVTFNQRSFKDDRDFVYKIKTIGVLINDVIEIVNAIHNKYKYQEIILLLEGYSCSLIKEVLKSNIFISKVILVNLVTNNKVIKFSFSSKFSILFGMLLNINKRLNVYIDYSFFTENTKYISDMRKNKQIYYLDQILQLIILNNKVIKNVNFINCPTLLLQNKNSIFSDDKNISKIVNSNIRIIEFNKCYGQYLFVDLNYLFIFNEINNFIK